VLVRPATGAVLGQVTQALAGLVLQVAAARTLGLAGLATFALVHGAIVLATAVASGMVGDSLTVLDRHEPRIRAGLHVWAVLVAGGAGLVGGLLGALTGLVGPVGAVVLGLAVTAFVLEDTLRRLLMAAGRWWSLPAVDGTSLVFSLLTLGGCALAGRLTLPAFLLALLVGQTCAAVVAWAQAPRAERPGGPWRAPDLRSVWAFGSWRAASQTVRPGVLTVLRLVVVGGLGAAAYGPLEAARVYTAPTLVLVAGLGSYLLPHYVATRGRSAARSIRAADRAALGLAAAVGAITALAVVLLPVAGPLLTGGDYAVPVLAVAGWGAYAVAGAFLLPYSGLATVHRRQRRVLTLRLLEFAALAPLGALVLLVDGGGQWAPLALAAGPVLVGVAVRQAVLRPLARQEAAARPAAEPPAAPVLVATGTGAGRA
jgi:O-antigen/teichoic acid export membrane protein